MKRIITHIGGFFIFFCISVVILDTIFFSVHDVLPSWHRIQDDEEIDVLILGNSHAYSSTDALILSGAWGKNVEIFAASSQNMEESLIHLKWAIKYKSPEYVILEIFSPCAHTREALQEDSRGILITDLDGIDSYSDKFNALAKTLKWSNIPEGMFQLFRPIKMWSRWNFKDNKRLQTSASHGYSSTDNYATGSMPISTIVDAANNEYQEESLTTYNEAALREFFEITQKKGIKVILYKAPVMRLSILGPMKSVFNIAKEYDNVVTCIDSLKYMDAIGIELEDFHDSGHLNRRGGEKFTYYMANTLAPVMGYDCSWLGIWGYKGESVKQLLDGDWEYTAENYDEDTLYRFELYKNDELIESQDYSTNNTFIYSDDIRTMEEYDLFFHMIPSECLEEGDSCSEHICFSFMKPNESVIE